MYNVSKRKVGEHNNRVRLEVGAELFGDNPEGQCCLLETGISSFCPYEEEDEAKSSHPSLDPYEDR